MIERPPVEGMEVETGRLDSGAELVGGKQQAETTGPDTDLPVDSELGATAAAEGGNVAGSEAAAHGSGSRVQGRLLPEPQPPLPQSRTGDAAAAKEQGRKGAGGAAAALPAAVVRQLDLNDRLQELLDQPVDLTLSQLLLDMQGDISCAGKAVMQLSSFQQMAELQPQLRGLLPERDGLGNTRYRSCAVVGNSGALLGAGHGPAIDHHDAVVRFNAAPTKDFQADVGTKTTIRMQNVDHLGFHEHQDRILLFSMRSPKDLARFSSHEIRAKSSRHVQYAVNPEFWCNVHSWVANRKLKPSTGLAGVVLALRICQHPIDMFGFSYNASEFHYFNKLSEKVSQQVFQYHPLVEEAAVFEQLQQQGLLRIIA